ncbi:MAG TPA: exonuclease domain-containing protein, partial [Acidimicrobiales bacterium]
VLPSLLEFCRDAVIVGHNIRFDLSFLDAALVATGRPRLRNRSVDTCALARRLVRDEVPNCKLSTLAQHFRVAHRPTHRALDDALATGEVLHSLLERAGSLGVLALDDLMELPTVKGHPMVAKLAMTASIPRKPGVYLFKDGCGRVLSVGKAVDLRRRVRSYFSSDDRRKVGALLRETQAVDTIVTSGELEAGVLEVRLIAELAPRFNRQAKLWRKYAYLKLTLNERFPRLSVVRVPKAGDGCLYIGPLASAAAAKVVAEAIESSVPIRRCTARPGKVPRPGVCTPAQLGVALCPCAGGVAEEAYAEVVGRVVRGLTVDPTLLLRPLEDRMRALAAAQRYEEAAAVRERAAALSRAIARQRRLDALRRSGRVTVSIEGEGAVVLHGGRLVAAWTGDTPPLDTQLAVDRADDDGPVPRELVDELATVASYLDTKAGRLRLVESDGELAWPLPRLPRYEPRKAVARIA